jgi:hypothetical protein
MIHHEAMKKPFLKFLLLGCGTITLLLAAMVIWLGHPIFSAPGDVKLTPHHPFRSAQAKERYLQLYDARAKSWPIESESRMVATSYGQTFVRVSGSPEAPPLVLLPGANAASLLWRPNIAALSEHYGTFAVDNIYDFGRSIYTRRLETPEDFVNWLEELLSGLELDDEVHLLGLSYGGWITCQYALQRPERLGKVVLVAPAAKPYSRSTPRS